MTAPTFKVSLGFGATWTTLDADIVWEDATPYAHIPSGFSSNRGRSTETDDDQAGTCSFRLNNEDRRFDPTYSSGPYFGDLKPGVPVKVEAVANGNTYPVYRGFVEGWPQDYAPGNTYGWVDVRCTDGFAKLATAGMPTSVLAHEIATDAPDVWYRLDEKSGTQMGDSSGGARNGTYRSPVDGVQHPNPWETVSAVGFSSDVTGEYTPTYPVSYPLTLEACLVIPTLDVNTAALGDGSSSWALLWWNGTQLAVAVNDGGTLSELGSVSGTFTAGEAVHILASFEDASTGVFYVNGTAVDSSVGSSADVRALSGVLVGHAFDVAQFDGEPITDVAAYSSDLDATRAAAHGEAFVAPWDGDTTGERIERLLDVAGWPADLRDVATGLSTLGPAVLGAFALQLVKRANGAEQGRCFVSRDGNLTFLDRYYAVTVTEGSTSQATLSDDGTDPHYSRLAFDYDTALVKNRISASRRNGTEIEVTDATSITDYGDRSDTGLTGLDFSNDYQAQSAAEFRLEVYKEPSLRVRPVSVKLHGISAAQQEALLGLELGYRVTVERTPQGVGSIITQQCQIEGISHRVSRGEWETEFRLSPIPDHMSEVALFDEGEFDSEVFAY